MVNGDVLKFTKLAEGLSLKPYRCPAGKLTIGYGHNLEANGISEAVADLLLINDLKDASETVNKSLGYIKEPYYGVAIDMVFNLGPKTFLSFKRLNKALANQNKDEILTELVDSKWFFQVGNRSKAIWLAVCWDMTLGELVSAYGDLKTLATKYFPSAYCQWFTQMGGQTTRARLKEMYEDCSSAIANNNK